jgi:hypothetical protein
MRGETNKGYNKHHTKITQVTNAAATERNIFWVFKYFFSKYHVINVNRKTDELYKDTVFKFYTLSLIRIWVNSPYYFLKFKKTGKKNMYELWILQSWLGLWLVTSVFLSAILWMFSPDIRCCSDEKIMNAVMLHKTHSASSGRLRISTNRLLKSPCPPICNNYKPVGWRILWEFSSHFSNGHRVPWKKIIPCSGKSWKPSKDALIWSAS